MGCKEEYLKNELRVYNTLKMWIEKDCYVFDNRIAYYEEKIKEIDIQLNSGNAKGIDYEYVSTSAVREPLLLLLAEQEKYINRRDELLKLKKQDIYGFKARIKYVESCLDKLDEKWKRDFIMDIYCEGKKVDEVVDRYPYERRQLYRFKDELINSIV